MPINQSVNEIFHLLEDSLIKLTDKQYNQKINALSGATIGQHVRHVVEMFLCLQEGYLPGIVNYEKRKRDIVIETSSVAAVKLMRTLVASLYTDNKELMLEAGFDADSYEIFKIPTNYFREIAYNLEHAIHHMALVRVGIQEVSHIILPETYGVASSTIKYRKITV